MAWIVGQVTKSDLAVLKKKYEEVNILTPEQEKALWGDCREDEDDQEPMIVVYLDCDATELL